MCKCGCNTCETKIRGPLLTEGKVKSLLSEGLQYHINKQIPLFETVYRIGSNKHLTLIKEARKMYSRGIIDLCEDDEHIIKTHLGEFGDYNEEIEYGSVVQIDPNEFPSFEFPFGTQGKIIGIDNDYMTDNYTYTVKIKYIDGQGDIATELVTDGINGFIFETQIVPLDLPMLNEEEISEAEFKGKDVQLNKPKRGGSKAYYVYVRDPKTKKVKKVSFGSGGLRAKIKNKEARNAFAKRHRCSEKKDRTKAGYWSCNLPRYAQALGLGANMNTFW